MQPIIWKFVFKMKTLILKYHAMVSEVLKIKLEKNLQNF